MKKKIPILILTFQFTVQALLLAANNNDTNRITAIIDSIENTFAPDKRIAVFDIEYRMGSENTVILSGVTDLPPARDALENSLKAFGLNVDNVIFVPMPTMMQANPHKPFWECPYASSKKQVGGKYRLPTNIWHGCFPRPFML